MSSGPARFITDHPFTGQPDDDVAPDLTFRLQPYGSERAARVLSGSVLVLFLAPAKKTSTTAHRVLGCLAGHGRLSPRRSRLAPARTVDGKTVTKFLSEDQLAR